MPRPPVTHDELVQLIELLVNQPDAKAPLGIKQALLAAGDPPERDVKTIYKSMLVIRPLIDRHRSNRVVILADDEVDELLAGDGVYSVF